MQGTNWVKCSDSLPNIDTPVFAGWFSKYDGKFVFHKFVRTDEQGEDGWIWLWSKHTDQFISDNDFYEQDDDYPITHWMPLPLPPMPEGE
ncbi:TPA: DUF551 domain-containing protein [Providencia rettgeri]